jgi:transposase
MIQISAQMRVLVAIEPVDGRKGIDSLARLCQEKLAEDPFSGCVFVFRSRSGTAIRLLTYDGQGYWLAQKRLSKGRFVWWPEADGPTKGLEAYEAQLLMAGWRRVPRPRGADVAASERAEIVLTPLRSKKNRRILRSDGRVQVPGPGDHAGRHPLYMRLDRAAPARQPPQAIHPAL